jgi:hypothetical protein
MPYAIQNVFILLGPALFAASIYMCLGRLIRGVRGDRYSQISPRKLTATFVSGDVLSFLVQGGASGLMVTGKNIKIAEGIVIAGLLIQVVMFGLFATTAIIFRRRIQRNSTEESLDPRLPWKNSMRMLYIVSTLIMIRSLFRVVEYGLGYDGYPLKHEWTLYIFDTVPMFTVMVVYYFWYPAWISSEGIELKGGVV